MKPILMPLLAVLALPTTVNADSYWLILTYGERGVTGGGGIEKIEMPTLGSCEKEGRKWDNSPTQKEKSKFRSFHCVVGK